jgi:hypothetical protein
MTDAALSKDRLARLHDILAGHVERAAAPRPPAIAAHCLTGAYAAIA